MTSFSVLFVCIGNVCRSPLGERLLASRLASGIQGDFTVASAGVRALAGSPMAPEAAVELERLGGTAEGFVSRQLTDEMLRSSDLVLTATLDLRSRVLEDVPAALRRTFTVREFAALIADADGDDLRAAVASAAATRSRVRLDDNDIPDPYRRGEEANRHAADLMADAVDQITKQFGARSV